MKKIKGLQDINRGLQDIKLTPKQKKLVEKVEKISSIPFKKRTKEQQKFINKIFEDKEEREISKIRIEWIDKKNKKVKLTFNDFLKVDIRLYRIKGIIDTFLKDKKNLKIYNKK